MPIPPVKISKTPMSPAERMKKSYLKRKEEDPVAHREFLEKKKRESKERRDKKKASMTEEEKEVQRALVRERLKIYRQKRKERGTGEASAPKVSKPLTRKEQEKIVLRKEKDRERKRLERQGWSRQKRKAESLKATERKKRKVMQEISGPELEESVKDGSGRSEAARRKAVLRASKALPKDPTAMDETLDDLCRMKRKSRTNAWQQKTKELLQKCDRSVVKGIVRHLCTLDKRLKRASRNMLGISRQHLWNVKNNSSFHLMQGRKTIDKSKFDLVLEFLKTNCTTLSEKRHVTKSGPGMVLKDQMNRLFQSFVQKYPDVKISRSFFYKCRAKCMKLPQLQKLNQCLCELCANIDLKLDALKPALPSIPASKTELLNAVLCNKRGELHAPECISLRCKECGPDGLKSLMKDCKKDISSYKEWVTVKKEKSSKKKLVVQESSTEELLEKLIVEMRQFPQHIFNARWQAARFNEMRKNPQNKEVVMVYDFAENYRTSYQDEIQAAHWTYEQVTIHPVVCYYRCSQCDLVTTHSVVALSDDLNHDSYAVDTFVGKVTSFLMEAGVKIERTCEWSDGCMAQYKSKGPFCLLQNRASAGLKVDRHFFGSRHGKNPSDGESAIIKSAVSRAVKCRRSVIQSATELFDFAQKNLSHPQPSACQHFVRSFVFVKSDEITRDRLPPLKTVKGTREIHSMHSSGQTVKFRNLSCSCQRCREGQECPNTTYVEQW